MSRTYISRNDFLRYVQCKKTLYLKNLERPEVKEVNYYANKKIFRNYRSASEEKVIDYARSMFANGITVERNLSLDEKLSLTKKYLDEKAGLIFSGWFEYRNVALFVDILEMRKTWNAYSIKTGGGGGAFSAPVDMALQYYVLKGNGIDPGAFWAIYINKRYRYTGPLNSPININQFFRVRDFLPNISESIAFVEKTMDEISSPLVESEVSSIDIGNHCYNPLPCPYMETCWGHIPQNSVFEIATLDRTIKFEMYHKGIVQQKDINLEEYPDLSANQKLQIESTIQNKTTIRKSELAEFLDKIQYPVHYLDFESFMPVIPLFIGTFPLQHIPFEYCIYTRDCSESNPDFKMYLAEASSSSPQDPRREFVKNLIRDIGVSGTILVYDSRLEIQQLREIAGLYPEFKEDVESIIARIVDLTYPFHKKIYYTPQMKGLYSIKSLLPAIFPDMTYDNLAIKNGYMAMHAFESLFYETRADVIARVREDLKEYCKMDVLALVEIHRFLETLI